jgi:hypothetical protein
MKLPNVPERMSPSSVFSNVERAIHECLAVRQFGPNEMQQVVAFFGRSPVESVYCGSVEVARWDHLIPIRRGGET